MSVEFPSLARVIADHFPSEYAGGWGWCNHYHSDAGEPFEFESFEHWGQHVIAAIREACTVTTVAELDDLPVETVLRDASGQIFEKSPDGEGDTPWWYDGDPHYITDIALPARVIHNPDWETK